MVHNAEKRVDVLFSLFVSDSKQEKAQLWLLIVTGLLFGAGLLA
jgi:hypothetical protein